MRAAHLPILVALAEAIGAGCVAELGGLSEQLSRVLVVDEYDVFDTALV